MPDFASNLAPFSWRTRLVIDGGGESKKAAQEVIFKSDKYGGFAVKYRLNLHKKCKFN